MERFMLTQEEGKKYIGSLFVGGNGPYAKCVIRLLDINEKGKCLWEQLPTFLIPSERDKIQPIEGSTVPCDFMVINHDEKPYPPKRIGILINYYDFFFSVKSKEEKESKVMLYFNKVPYALTEPYAVHPVHTYGWTPGCRTQLGKDLGLSFVPKRKPNKYIVPHKFV